MDTFLKSLTEQDGKYEQRFKENFPKIIETIHNLVLLNSEINNIDVAWGFVDLIIQHFSLIANDIKAIESIVHMLIDFCQKIFKLNVDEKWMEKFMYLILRPFAYKLIEIKPKQLAILYVDLILSILNLRVVNAPEWACRFLNKQEFYPWKDIASNKIPELIQSCLQYDTFDITNLSGNDCVPLKQLASILDLLYERSKTQTIILKYSHPIAVEYTMKWINQTPDELKTQVLSMGSSLLYLIDRSQVDTVSLGKLMDLFNKVVENDEIDLTNGPLTAYYI
ncbi:unnamed protein product, partial [Didymodactylos carnosus]